MSIRHQFLALLGTAIFTGPVFAAAPDKAPADPAAYVSVIDNPWFPLTPGTTLVYKGKKDEKRADREFEVMAETRIIGGVTCLIAEDRVTLGGKPAEKTIGYYAQDKDGNVWTFGEESQELDKKGNVKKTEGWLTGVDGAVPGLLMEAAPAVGDGYTHATSGSRAEVLKLTATVEVPYGSFKDALQIKDWNPAEPDTLSHKFYLRGVGEVRDVEVKEGSEDLKLVEIKTGG